MSRSVPGSAVWRAMRSRALVVTSLLVALLAAAPAAHAERSTLSSGDRQTCVVTTGGEVACWGASKRFVGTAAGPALPTIVPGLSGVKSVATGALAYQCALRVSGSVGCWGAGYYRDFDVIDLFEISPVQPVETESGDAVTTFVDIAVNDREGCGAKADGTVDCWRPDGPALAIPRITDATSITSNGTAFCARRATGGVACWDRGLSRQTDTTGEGGSSVEWTDGAFATDVPGLTDVVSLSGLCAVLTDKTVSCWTIAHRPERGNESLTFTAPETVPGISSAVQVASGASHSCATLVIGRVACWGSNADGQFPTATVIPTELDGITMATTVSVTSSSTCVLMAVQAVRCLGNARHLADGVLGNPSRTAAALPIRPMADLDVRSSDEPRPAGQTIPVSPPPSTPNPVEPAAFGDFQQTSIVLRWNPPINQSRGLREYVVRYGTTEIPVAPDQGQVQINGLTPGTEYDFKIVAVSNISLESPALEYTYRTLNQVVLGVPEFEEPTDSDVTETSLTVRWQPTGNATISGFRISLDGVEGQSFRVGESARSFTFTGLSAGTDYTVLLSALSPEGNESQAAVQILVTREGPLPTATPTPTVSPTPTPTVSPTPVLTERRYTVKGTTTIKTLTKSAMPLIGTAALIVDDRSQPVQASLSLNDTQARSTAFGFLPITATIGFATSGGVAISPDSTLTLAFKARIKVKSVKAFGAIPIAGGNNCQTKALSTIPLSVSPGFTLAAGGMLGGTYAISDLNGCGILNGLVSPLVASTGNTMNLTLTSR